MMLGEQQPVMLSREADEDGANQRRLIEQKAGTPVFRFDQCSTLITVGCIQSAAIVVLPRHRTARGNNLQRLSLAILMEGDTQAGMALEKGIQGVAQAGGVHDAIQFEHPLDKGGVLAFTLVMGI